MVRILAVIGIMQLIFLSTPGLAVQSELAKEMGFTKAHKQGITGKGQTILLFDDNPHFFHPALNGAIHRTLMDNTMIDNTMAKKSHGLGVRGIIQTQPGIYKKDYGLAFNCQVLSNNRILNEKGFLDLIQNQGRIINCSCNMKFKDIDVNLVKNHLLKNDAILVIASGNKGSFLSKNPEGDWLLDPEIRERTLFVGNVKLLNNEFDSRDVKTNKKLFEKKMYKLRETNYPLFKGKSKSDLHTLSDLIHSFFEISGWSWKKLIDESYVRFLNEQSGEKIGDGLYFGKLNFNKTLAYYYYDSKSQTLNHLIDQVKENAQALFSLQKVANWFGKTDNPLEVMNILILLAHEYFPVTLTDKSPYMMDDTSNRFGLCPFPMICAIGHEVQVLSYKKTKSNPKSIFEKSTGTSLSTPIVSSALALAFEACNGNISAKELIHLVQSTAHKPNKDVVHYFGSGVLNLPSLLDHVSKQKVG